MSARTTTGFVVMAATVALDQASKWWLLGPYDIGTRQPVEVTSFFNLVLTWNTGISFGLLGTYGDLTRWLLTGFAVAVAIALAVWMIRATNLLLTVALAFVIGGALGNAIDRVVHGAVADFFDFHLAGWHFWAFNIADSAISIGVALLLWDAFFGSGRRQSE
ncbi:signal peptidase II [Iodidimonas sp. SYSU 1G8]|uniref:signal peptidase II n=1 Tax=Iodidimonas sp. SYSU 1G8 TaxID=3133967 RepID=UPI0031FE86E8